MPAAFQGRAAPAAAGAIVRTNAGETEMKFHHRLPGIPLAAAFALAGGIYSPLHAQPSGQEAGQLEEIIVTGARGRPRTVSDSPVPVDVFTAEDIESIAHADTNDIIKTLVPSYNITRQPISDGATFIRPANLRGMPTDKTLVLVNSKRRHRAALVAIGGSGTQGPDLATIPSSALQNVEVLRDGAAAQYGSDAIAGVINMILKNNREGFDVSLDFGEYGEGDGTSTTLQANVGMPLGSNGFLSVSAESHQNDATVRSEQYCESWFCVDPSLPGYSAFESRGMEDPRVVESKTASYQANTHMANIGDGDVVQPWGAPDNEANRLFFNAGIEFADGSELYGFGNYSESTTHGGFFYRYPYNGTIEYIRRPDGSRWWSLEFYPGGFTPRFYGDVYDLSVLGGLRGEYDNGMTWDFSVRTGESEVRYTLSNTVNPSMGPDSPRTFRPGDLINSEFQIQADFTYEFDNATNTLLAFGGTIFDEEYEVVEGERASYAAGPYALPDPWGFCNDDGTPTAAGMGVIGNGSDLDCSDSSDPVFRAVGVGSNGFPGYSPQFSDVYDRSSYAVYADVSSDVTDRMFLQGAVRYENYDDFDAVTVWKMAGRYSLTDDVGLRASVGTGFRAPTPGQQGTINVSTRLPQGFPVATGLFPAGGPVAAALGAEPLKPERSDNYTFGLTANVGDVDLTIDWYRIDIQDRTQSVSTLDVSTDPTSGDAYQNFLKLEAAGVPGANTIGGVFYFANGFDTKTEGVDVVASVPLDLGAGSTTLTGALNWNKSEFASDPSEYLNAEARYDFENFLPKMRGVLTLQHGVGDLNLVGRLNHYGGYTNSNSGGNPLRFQEYDPVTMFDLEAQYRISETLDFALGGRNIFDAYPDEGTIGDNCCGRLYLSASYVSWQGAYWYGRVRASF